MPNDSIFYTALNQDSTIYEYAYEKGIFITTPLTLLMALKTVYICWRNLKSDENAMRILSEAGRMYDKFRVFTEQFDKLESQLNTVIKTVSSSKTTLYDGSGNLLSRFENLKKLGAKTNKNISKIYNESAENNLI
ncbi:DNA recombination protein RmuC [Campylobacter fetus]|nr:DNA recombination protein RmuC [Campylobacter fetus]ELY2069338.1 DNA recombination protein RmuC [Campylobacter fetus]HEG5082925.1 DNA recombination protein RmuC [Campylobacter fetus]